MSDIFNSVEEIVFVDQQVYSLYKCPICHRIFRDPVVSQCGVCCCFYCFLSLLIDFIFPAYVLSKMYFFFFSYK